MTTGVGFRLPPPLPPLFLMVDTDAHGLYLDQPSYLPDRPATPIVF